MSGVKDFRGTESERIVKFIAHEPFSGCWLWIGNLGVRGYGVFWRDGRMRIAHRIAYEIYRGKIPEGLELDHTCRNHCCVNPDHLEAVTHAENMRRSQPIVKTHCPAGHPYDEANTLVVTGKRGNPERQCRTCTRTNSREFARRRRLETPRKSTEEIAANRLRAARDPERRAKISATLRKIRNTPEGKLKLSEQARKTGRPNQMHTPEATAKRIAGIREYWKSDEAKQQQSERIRAVWTPEMRERQRQNLRSRWAKRKAGK